MFDAKYTMDVLTSKTALSLTFILFFAFCSNTFAQVAELSQKQQIQMLHQAARQCLDDINSHPVTLTGLYCNRTWDNVMCWPDTAASTVGYQPCPPYINMFDQAEFATKRCLENGTWYVHPEQGKPWTNYTSCLSTKSEDSVPAILVEHMPGVKLMATVGYSLSLAALIMAVSTMIYFKRLHCPRNMIHLNMFLAFLVRAGLSLLKTVLLVNDLGFPKDVNITGNRVVFIQEGTHWECKLFFTLFYYIILASLMWLFNEGLYLVLILSVSVFVEKTKVRWFVVLGWGFPVLFVIPWVVCRIVYDDMLCWNLHVQGRLFWILRGPMIISVGVNFVFFIVIIRMLFSKLTASHCPESKKVRYRKLAKSTLILIPLFAVYYMGLMWLPYDLSPAVDIFKIYVEMLFNSFQGFLVALLFCFLNAEVQGEIRKKWQQKVLSRDGSMRSQPSFASFSRRTTVPKDSGHIRRHSHSRSLLDSSASTSIGQHVMPDKRANGQLAPICEEASPLKGENHQETSAQICLGQDLNDNHQQEKTSLQESFAGSLCLQVNMANGVHLQENTEGGVVMPTTALCVGEVKETDVAGYDSDATEDIKQVLVDKTERCEMGDSKCCKIDIKASQRVFRNDTIPYSDVQQCHHRDVGERLDDVNEVDVLAS